MSKDKDFDELDSNNDGYLSKEEFKKGKKPSGIEKEKLNWFLRLLTLGDRFDIRDFWDRLKKSIVEFIILVFGVTVSFGIEQQGGESDNRADGIENLVHSAFAVYKRKLPERSMKGKCLSLLEL